MQGRNVRFQGKYDLFTIYLIPGVTIFLASFDSWTGTNLSVLGNRTGNKLLFAVWGFATGIYYCVCPLSFSHRKIQKSRRQDPDVYSGSLSSHGGYDSLYAGEISPEGRPPCAACIFFACASGLQYHLASSRFLSSRDRMRFRRAWGILWMMAACSVLFLLEAGFITSFLEIFIITGLCGYLRYMEQLLAT